MSKINVTINGEKYDFDKGITLFEISKKLKLERPALAGFMNNEIFPLDTKARNNVTIRFLDVLDPVGNRIYQKGLLYILVYAFKELFGYDYSVTFCHSIDKAIKIKSDLKLNNDRINSLKNKMREVIDADMPIEKCLVSRKDARNYFLSISNKSKADTFIYNTNHYVTLYKLGDMYDYFFSIMPISTSVMSDFDLLLLDSNSFILQFPTTTDGGKIPEYVDRNMIGNAFDEDYDLLEKLSIYNSCDLNKAVADGKISDIIKLTETASSNKLIEIAKEIYDRRDKLKLVFIGGPSSSGKTTTTKKLVMFLKSFGLNPKSLSGDDYFVEREKLPKLPTGEYDFENVEAVDLEWISNDLRRIIVSGEEVQIPTYNFYTGKSEYRGNTIKLGENDILIVEGLHAVNGNLTAAVPKEKKYNIYISPLPELNIDCHNMISTTDIRLLRRIVRDNRSRGYNAEQTLAGWQRVRDGEEKYIFPYQNDVDCVYNTSLLYEIGVLKLYAEPLLYAIDNSSEYYDYAVRLLNFLNMFVGIPTDEIPSESILREFIGHSYFE